MDSLIKSRFRWILVILIVFFVLLPKSFKCKSSERINPLRFGKDTKSWQLTLNFSRYLDKADVKTINSSGLWEKEKTIDGTSYNLQSSFELNERIGFRGGFSYFTDSVRTSSTNLWTGIRETAEKTSERFGEASLKIKIGLWENSELRTHFLVPVLGGPMGVGLVWSRDPVMIFPKLTFDGEEFGLNTGISFVANSKIALTGRLALREAGDSSVVGFGGGLVYRYGEYDGVQFSASLRRGDTTQVSLEVGLSYGEEEK